MIMKLDLTEIPAIYLNLQQHVEKNDNMQKILNECGFKKIIRVEGVSRPDNPVAGCSGAHLKGLSEIKPPFVLFEDDCQVKNFRPNIEIPDDSDAVHLGISSWGRMNSHSGPCVQCENIGLGLVRIYNMLSAHAILYINQEFISMCSRIAYQAYEIADYQDIGFAEIQKYFNVYAFNDPMFFQTSSNGTDKELTSYPSFEILQPHRSYWKPTALY